MRPLSAADPPVAPAAKPSLISSAGVAEGPTWRPQGDLNYSGGNRIQRRNTAGQPLSILRLTVPRLAADQPVALGAKPTLVDSASLSEVPIWRPQGGLHYSGRNRNQRRNTDGQPLSILRLTVPRFAAHPTVAPSGNPAFVNSASAAKGPTWRPQGGLYYTGGNPLHRRNDDQPLAILRKM